MAPEHNPTTIKINSLGRQCPYTGERVSPKLGHLTKNVQ